VSLRGRLLIGKVWRPRQILFVIAAVSRRFLVKLLRNPEFLAGESGLFQDTFDIWHTLGNIASDEAVSAMTHGLGLDRRFRDSLYEAHRSTFYSAYLFQSTSPRCQSRPDLESVITGAEAWPDVSLRLLAPCRRAP